MNARIVAKGIVAAPEEGTDRQSCAFPSICVLPGGRWLCAFRAAPAKSSTTQKVLLSRSDDYGEHWSEIPDPFKPFSLDGRTGLFRGCHLTAMGGDRVLATLCWVDHSEPSLPFFNEQTEGLLDTRIFFSHSDDGGETWSEPALMDTTPFNAPTPITGPVLVLPDGKLACQFELNKHYYDTTEWRHSSVLMYSSDAGETWPEYSVVSSDSENRIFYWDQRPAVLADGRILDLFWTFDREAAVYLNIHARESLDSGATWSGMWDTGIPGQPAPPVSLPDGTIGMVYVDRTCSPVIKMCTSNDHGRTWAKGTEIVLYSTNIASQSEDKKSMQDAWSEMGKFSVGLPDTASLPDGDILVVYYAGPHADRTQIEWVRVHPV